MSKKQISEQLKQQDLEKVNGGDTGTKEFNKVNQNKKATMKNQVGQAFDIAADI